VIYVDRINLNELARDITLQEGKKQSISIAQVKEVLKLYFEIVGATYTDREILATHEWYENR
jgi:hypothetical protein